MAVIPSIITHGKFINSCCHIIGGVIECDTGCIIGCDIGSSMGVIASDSSAVTLMPLVVGFARWDGKSNCMGSHAATRNKLVFWRM